MTHVGVADREQEESVAQEEMRPSRRQVVAAPDTQTGKPAQSVWNAKAGARRTVLCLAISEGCPRSSDSAMPTPHLFLEMWPLLGGGQRAINRMQLAAVWRRHETAARAAPKCTSHDGQSVGSAVRAVDHRTSRDSIRPIGNQCEPPSTGRLRTLSRDRSPSRSSTRPPCAESVSNAASVCASSPPRPT